MERELRFPDGSSVTLVGPWHWAEGMVRCDVREPPPAESMADYWMQAQMYVVAMALSQLRAEGMAYIACTPETIAGIKVRAARIVQDWLIDGLA